MAALGLCVLPAVSADIRVRRDTVVPIRFEDEVRMRSAQEGKRVRAVVLDNEDLPEGSILTGQVVRVTEGSRNRPGSVEIRFMRLRLPAGNEIEIDAMPIPMTSQYVQKRGTRWMAKNGKTNTENTVIGGALGGLVLGSLIKKPFEGAVIGALGGILAAEVAKKDDGDLVISRGAKAGAVLLSDLQMDDDYRSRGNSRDDSDDRRSTGWPGRDDQTRRDDRDDRDSRDSRYDRQDRGGRNEVAIFLDSRELRFGAGDAPYLRDGVAMVPLLSTARQLKLDVEVTGTRYLLESEEGALRLEDSSATYRLNGRRGELARPTEKRNRVVYVPLEALQKLQPNLESRIS